MCAKVICVRRIYLAAADDAIAGLMTHWKCENGLKRVLLLSALLLRLLAQDIQVQRLATEVLRAHRAIEFAVLQ